MKNSKAKEIQETIKELTKILHEFNKLIIEVISVVGWLVILYNAIKGFF